MIQKSGLFDDALKSKLLARNVCKFLDIDVNHYECWN